MFGATAAIAAFFAGEITQGPPSNSPLWAYLLVGLAGFGASLLGQLLFRRQTKDRLIAGASDEVAQGAKALLEEYRLRLDDYRIELDRARAEVKELREQVEELERKLRHGTAEREKLTSELASRLDQIDELERTIHKLEKEMVVLRKAVHTDNPDEPTG
jgi:chromosome segregation ATPase